MEERHRKAKSRTKNLSATHADVTTRNQTDVKENPQEGGSPLFSAAKRPRYDGALFEGGVGMDGDGPVLAV